MSNRAPVAVGSDPAAEVGSLARELARGYRELVESYRTQMGLTPEDADSRARDPGHAAWQDRYLTDPPDQVSWWGLSSVIERDPERGYAIWARIKDEARKELASGHRAALTLKAPGQLPWDRARFLAIREAFWSEWKPQGGVESALVEALAMSFAEYLRWTARLTTDAETEGQIEDHKLKKEGYWQPPRVAVAAAIEQAARMADRAHRRFLLTLRAIQDHRRLPAIRVERAGQINVGGHQINLAAPLITGGTGTPSGAIETEVTQRDGMGAETARRPVLHAQPQDRRTSRPRVRRHGAGGGRRGVVGRGRTGAARGGTAGAASGVGRVDVAGRGSRDARRAGGGAGASGADGGGLPATPPGRMEETAR